MATPQQQQDEFDKLLRRLQSLNAPVDSFRAAFDAAKTAGRGVNDVLEDMEARITRITRGQSFFAKDSYHDWFINVIKT
jgi:hypothetical protein